MTVAFLCLSATSRAVAASKSVTASLGDVAATLTYHQGSDSFGNPTFSQLRLLITNSGQSLHDEPVTSRFCGSECWVESFAGGPLFVKDLEGNGQPAVVLDLYTGGAHCCSVVQVFSYDPAVMTYRLTEHDFGDPGARLTDVDGNGSLQFESADDRFAYEFTSFAYSGLPRQIWRFQNGRFLDVTRQFPQAVAADARRQWRQFLADRRQGLGLGFIAAWAADEDLLGHGTAVTRTLAKQARLHQLRSRDGLSPSGSAFIRKLNRFLKKTGYS